MEDNYNPTEDTEYQKFLRSRHVNAPNGLYCAVSAYRITDVLDAVKEYLRQNNTEAHAFVAYLAQLYLPDKN